MSRLVFCLLCAAGAVAAFNWPIAPVNQPHPLGNNWGEYQDYGGGAYFHNGIDIFPLATGAPVYAVAHGWVKAWGTIQANLHYRLAISDSAMANTGRCTGWLYAHIDPARPHKNVGDEVQAGELIGYLVDFPYNFQHIHFARISDTGATWQRFPNYTWWFIQNPLTLLESQSDTVRPVFENARSGSRFAFCRDNSSSYLDPDSLYGNVDIIAKVYDKMTLSTGNAVWDRLAPFILDYRIRGDWDSLPWRLALSYKYGLPPPGTPEIGVVYKDDATCNTRGDYDYRDYFHIVTNTDGDSTIEVTDSTGRWATADFHDGYYWVFVRAKDAAGNARVDSQRVRVVNGNPPLDVACTIITAPAGFVDTGAVIAPACSVINNGPTTVSYSVRMRIGSGYNQTVPVSSHAPGERRRVSFPAWTAQSRGLNAVRCSTELAGDLLPANDRQLDSVTVLVHDAAVVAVSAPTGAVPPGSVVPRAVVRNNGTQREPVRVWFVIGLSYRDSVFLAAGLPLADTTLTFAQWTATPGSWVGRCSVAQVVDNVRANDTATAAFTVNAVDVGVIGLLAPADTVDAAATVVPGARLGNFGAAGADFMAWFRISGPDTDYRDSLVVVGLGSGESREVWFQPWTGSRRAGPYVARCSVAIAFDGNQANDTLSRQFAVVTGRPPVQPGWVEMPNLPLAPSNRAVKDGGWIVFDQQSDRFVIARGNKTPDMLFFQPVADTFGQLTPWPQGAEGRTPYRGAAACADGAGRVYAVKGNGTLGFWRYDIASASWEQLADVPAGPQGRKMKGGSDLVWVNVGDSGYVYLLKGCGCEFYRFNATTGEWQVLPDAPSGSRARWDRGSWLVYVPDSRPAAETAGLIVAHKARIHELYNYDPLAARWSAVLPGMPLLCSQTGKSRKSKDGGSAALLAGRIWALKGGNSQDFYSYDPYRQIWQEEDTMPAVGSTLKRRRVKAGGDIAAGSQALYALKGNRTLELWRYVPAENRVAAGFAGRDSRVGAEMADGLRVTPNPAAGRLVVHLPSARLSGSSVSQLQFYDAAGRRVHAVPVAGGSTVVTDVGRLPVGVYYLTVSGTTGVEVRLTVLR